MQRNGSETSSTQGKSPAATLTSGPLSSSPQGISKATPKPISSPVSGDGASLLGSPDGPMIDLFGLAPAPASPSLPPARARRAMTNATCGLRGFLSSSSAALQSSLESKLKRRLDGAGSTLFSLTWKAKATPAGRPYCQLAASARRTSGNDCGSWPTPKAQEDGRTLDQYEAARQRGYQRRIGKTSGGPASKQGGLAIAAQLAPTPMAGTPAQKGYNEAGNTDSGRKVVALSSWATPTSRDHKDGHYQPNVPVNALLGRQVWSASGPTPSGSPAQTESPGQLDPDHSRWVMGYRAEHLSCAPTETPSFLKSQRSSSRPRSRDY